MCPQIYGATQNDWCESVCCWYMPSHDCVWGYVCVCVRDVDEFYFYFCSFKRWFIRIHSIALAFSDVCLCVFWMFCRASDQCTLCGSNVCSTIARIYCIDTWVCVCLCLCTRATATPVYKTPFPCCMHPSASSTNNNNNRIVTEKCMKANGMENT